MFPLFLRKKGNIMESFEKRIDPRENIYYWISGESQAGKEAKDTDVGALAQGFITITPIQSDLTRYDLLDDLKKIMTKRSII
jgi:5'-nucleotidase